MLSRLNTFLRRYIPHRYLHAFWGKYLELRHKTSRCSPVPSAAQRNMQGFSQGVPKTFENPLMPARVISEHRYGKVMGGQKLLSIIYNYYKKDTTVFQSLDSIKNQAWAQCTQNDVEIILVDDGTPGEPIADQLPEDVIYVWQRKIGYGICRAKNTGARLANGAYLLFLDPDILLHSDFLDSMLQGFRTFGERVVQCGYIWDYHFVGCPDPRVEFGVWSKPNRLTRRFYQVAGGNLAISRSLFFETPGFDEDLIYGGVEDLLFGYHLSKLPATAVMFNDRMQSRHIPHPPAGAHTDPRKSWDMVQLKWPEFYDEYIVKGFR